MSLYNCTIVQFTIKFSYSLHDYWYFGLCFDYTRTILRQSVTPELKPQVNCPKPGLEYRTCCIRKTEVLQCRLADLTNGKWSRER